MGRAPKGTAVRRKTLRLAILAAALAVPFSAATPAHASLGCYTAGVAGVNHTICL
jgi:hypothetical protein